MLIALALVLFAVWPPAAANAQPPAIDSAEPGPLTEIVVGWTLPPGMRTYSIEVASSPETYADGENRGSFLTQNWVQAEILLTHHTTSWSTRYLPRDVYYVHVSAYDATTCPSPLALGCPREWSEVREVAIPPIPPVIHSAGPSLRSLFASWSLPFMMYTESIEIATAPETYPSGPDKGLFLEENLVWYDGSLSPNSTGYVTPGPLPGGIYYVHVTASTCSVPGASSCVREVSTPPWGVGMPSNAPLVKSAGQSNGEVWLTWSLPFDMRSDFVEVATSPAVYANGPARGFFLDEHVVLYDDSIGPRQLSYTAPVALPPGTYYAHVAAYATGTCPTFDAPTCVNEFSAPPVRIEFPGPLAASPATPGMALAEPPDDSTAFASLKAAGRQSVRRLRVTGSMSEPGTISASAAVVVPGLARVYRFRPVSKPASAGAAVQLRLRLRKKALRAVSNALKRKKTLHARVTITARDRADNVEKKFRRIRLTH
jgi:hypothetical protein